MTRRSWLCVVVAGLVLAAGAAAALLAEPGIVTTRDGQNIEGDVTEEGDHVNITIHGVTTIIPKSRVDHIRYRGDYAAEFHARLAKLEANDVAGRIALAREAFDQGKYDLSRDALEDALKIDPNNKEAFDMIELVLGQIRLERNRGAAPVGGPKTRPATMTSRPASAQTGAGGERRFLSADEINIIRQMELKPTDAAVRITFQADVKRAYAKLQNMTFADFNRLPPAQQALVIIENGTEDMRKQVRIASDPSAIAEYKRSVQPLVLSGCATTACHGGSGGAGLMLFAPADTDSLTYTNFYILQHYSKQIGSGEGIFGGTMRKLIDRGHPSDSLLMHYGLPTSIAQFDHPLVGGRAVPAIFRSKEDPRYAQIIKWIGETLKPIEPNYGIDYQVPVAGVARSIAPTTTTATTVPATTQARE